MQKLVLIFVIFFISTFSSITYSQNSSDFNVDFNGNNEGKKYKISISHINSISSVDFKIFECKRCNSQDLKEKIICNENKNLLLQNVTCTIPKSIFRNDIDPSVGSSYASLTCDKSLSKVFCKLKVTTVGDQNGKFDKNALTKLGNLILEENINLKAEKDLIEEKNVEVLDGKYFAEFILRNKGGCGELPLMIEIDVKDLFFSGSISNNLPRPENFHCKQLHTGKISGSFYKNGNIDKFNIETNSKYKNGAFKAEGHLNNAVLISKKAKYNPRTRFSLVLKERRNTVVEDKEKGEQTLVDAEKVKAELKLKEERALIEQEQAAEVLKEKIELELIARAEELEKEEKIKNQIVKEKIANWTLKDVNILLMDIEKFVSQNKKSLDPILFIKLFRPVKTIQKKKEIVLADIDNIDALNNFLMQNGDFKSYRNEKMLEREAERLRLLTIAQGKLQAILDFCMAYITNNTLADESYELTILYKSHEKNLKSKDKKIVEKSILEINKKLTSLGLKEDKVSKEQDHVKKDEGNVQKPKAKPENIKPKEENDQIAEKKPTPTKKIKKKKEVESTNILKEYQDKDIILYLNLLSSAPHTYRDLEGNIKFENNIINICWAHKQNIDTKYLYYLSLELQKKYKNHSIFIKEVCGLNTIEKLNSNYDGIIFSKQLFLKHKYSKIEKIINFIENKDYLQDFVVTYNDYNKYLSKREILSTQIEEDILDGNRNGYGSIVIDNNSNIVCLIADKQIEAHKVIIMRGKIYNEYQVMKGKKLENIIEVSIENGFKQTQRGNCGLLYAESANLAKLYKAIKNIKVKYQTIPNWVSIKDIEKTYKRIIDNEKKDLEGEAKRVAEEKLRKSEEDARRKKDLVDARNKQKELRRTYQPKVSAILEEFEKLIAREKAEKEGSKLYPVFVEWFAEKEKSGWEEDEKKTNSNIMDYGKVVWGEDRILEADIIQRIVSLKNRDQGLRKEHCFIFLKIVDVEFTMYREAFSVDCTEGRYAIDKWKKSFSFESLWNVEVLNEN